MATITHLLFQVFLFCYFDMIMSVTLSNPSHGKTTTPVMSAQNQSECLNTSGLQLDIDLILTRLDNISQINTNITGITDIISRLSGIEESVQNKLCQCADGTILFDIVVETKAMVADALLNASESAECACSNVNVIANSTKDILDLLHKIYEQVNINTDLLQKTSAEIDKINKLLALVSLCQENFACKENILRLEEDNKHMKHKLEEILKKVCEIRDRGCACEDEKLFEKVQEILKKLNLPSQHSHPGDTNLILDALENMNRKLDQLLLQNDTTAIEQENDCLTVSQFHEILPMYCEDTSTEESNVKPWELSEEATGDLLNKYKGCIKEAVRFFDDWFKDNAWSRMPTAVKQILVELYCKIGKKNMLTFKKFKKKLEAGYWKSAAKEFRKTNYAKRYPQFAEEIIKKLNAVKERMAKKKQG